MILTDLTNTVDASLAQHGHIRFTDEVFRTMDPIQVDAIRQKYGTRALLMLPEHEIAFMEWLKENDRPVWDDLWAAEPVPYLVSLAYLSDFAGKNVGGGYVICDLAVEDNYYFSPQLLLEKESNDFVGAIRDRFASRRSLTPAQLLALEASMGPVDVWHFAHRHDLPIDRVKAAVQELVSDRILLHVPNADHLVQYFDVH